MGRSPASHWQGGGHPQSHSTTWPLPMTACPAMAGPARKTAKMSNKETNANSLFKGHLDSDGLIACANTGRLVDAAEWLVSLRAFGAVGEIGARLRETPGGGDYSGAGDLYGALALNHTPGRRAQAERLLRQVLECGGTAFRAKALLALGSNRLLDGDLSGAVRYYHDSRRNCRDNLLTAYCATMMSIVARGLGGDHRGALAALESIRPLAALVGRYYPAYWYAYLNSLAVELGEVGKADEAMALARRAAGSVFASAYPVFKGTYEGLRARVVRKSVAVVRLGDHVPLIEQRIRSFNALLEDPPAEMVRRVYRIVRGYAPVHARG